MVRSLALLVTLGVGVVNGLLPRSSPITTLRQAVHYSGDCHMPRRLRANLLTRTAAAAAGETEIPGGFALLFDCDGVLADTERDGHRVSFNKVFEERGLGYSWDVEEYGRLCEVGGGKERMTFYMNKNNCWPADCANPTTEELVKGLPVDETRLALVKSCHARKTELFQELIASGVVPPNEY